MPTGSALQGLLGALAKLLRGGPGGGEACVVLSGAARSLFSPRKTVFGILKAALWSPPSLPQLLRWDYIMPTAHHLRHMNEDCRFSSGQKTPPEPWLRASRFTGTYLKRTSLEVPAFVTHTRQALRQVGYSPPFPSLLLGTAPATGHLLSPREQWTWLHSTGQEMKSSSRWTTCRACLLTAPPWPGLSG